MALGRCSDATPEPQHQEEAIKEEIAADLTKYDSPLAELDLIHAAKHFKISEDETNMAEKADKERYTSIPEAEISGKTADTTKKEIRPKRPNKPQKETEIAKHDFTDALSGEDKTKTKSGQNFSSEQRKSSEQGYIRKQEKHKQVILAHSETSSTQKDCSSELKQTDRKECSTGYYNKKEGYPGYYSTEVTKRSDLLPVKSINKERASSSVRR